MKWYNRRHHFSTPNYDPPSIFGVVAVLIIIALILLGLVKAAELLLPHLLAWIT